MWGQGCHLSILLLYHLTQCLAYSRCMINISLINEWMNESTQNLPSTRKEPLAGCREVIVPGRRCSPPFQHGCSHIWAPSGKWACGDLWDPTRLPPTSGRSPFEWPLQVITIIYSLCFCWNLNRGSLFNSGVLKCHMLLAEIAWTFPWFIRI